MNFKYTKIKNKRKNKSKKNNFTNMFSLKLSFQHTNSNDSKYIMKFIKKNKKNLLKIINLMLGKHHKYIEDVKLTRKTLKLVGIKNNNIQKNFISSSRNKENFKIIKGFHNITDDTIVYNVIYKFRYSKKQLDNMNIKYSEDEDNKLIISLKHLKKHLIKKLKKNTNLKKIEDIKGGNLYFDDNYFTLY